MVKMDCDNCGGEMQTGIIGIDEKRDDVYYGSKCKDCGHYEEA